ncbi:MAG: hypothetical protein ABFD16_29780 [Thermoguttaceae bacterium]
MRNGSRSLSGWFHPLVYFEDWTARLFEAESLRAYRICLALLVAFLLGVCGFVLATGCAHQLTNPWDAVGLLDAGWRVYLGQVPHRDFLSHLGIAYLGLVALGIRLAGPCGTALAYVGVLPVLPLGLCCWWIARRRFAAFPALVLSAMVGAMPAGTSQLGMIHDYRIPSYAMQYNRLGWAMVSIILVQMLLPRRRQDQTTPQPVGEYLISGVLIGLLLLIKINYALVAIGLVPFALFCSPPRFRSWLALAAGVALSIAAVAVFVPLDVRAFLDDQQNIAGVHKASKRIQEFWEVYGVSQHLILALLGVALFLIQPFGRLEPSLRRRMVLRWLRFTVAGAVAVLVGLALCSTNCQRKAIPTFAVGAMLLMEGFYRARKDSLEGAPLPADDRVRWQMCTWIFLILALPIVIYDAKSVSYCFLWKQIKAPRVAPGARLDSPTLGDLLLPPEPGEKTDRALMVSKMFARGVHGPDFTSYQYAAWMSDGATLLRRWTDEQSRIFAMDFLNPFPLFLKLPPPRGAPLCLHWKRLVSDEHRPSAERVFEEVTHVMVPKTSLVLPSFVWIQGQYGPYLHAHYRQVDASGFWTLYVRNDLAQPSTQSATAVSVMSSDK